MTVKDILDTVMRKYPHTYSDETIIGILNTIQRELFRTIYRPHTATRYDLIADNPFYSIGYSPQNITDVVVNGLEYPLKNISNRAGARYYYITDDNCVGIYPTPAEDCTDGLVIFRYKEPTPLTTSNLSLEPDFDKDWHMLLVYLICKELAETAFDAEMGNFFITQINGLEERFHGATMLEPFEIQMPYRW